MFWPVPLAYLEGVGNVDGEVDTEPDGDDEAVAGDHVDGEAPEVHEPSHVHNRGRHAEEDHAGTRHAAHAHNTHVS